VAPSNQLQKFNVLKSSRDLGHNYLRIHPTIPLWSIDSRYITSQDIDPWSPCMSIGQCDIEISLAKGDFLLD
jgi:hypothetical protein